jgi:uncharacterized membrane protein
MWQIIGSWAAGAVVAVVVGLVTSLEPVYTTLVGWDVGAVVYLVLVWRVNRRMTGETTAQIAVREDPTRPVTDVVLLVASIGSLGTVVAAVVQAGHSSGGREVVLVLLGVTSVAASWCVVHTLFATTYARAYYTDEDGGVDFNGHRTPAWTDFAYLAFTIGMTYQVSDTALQTSGFRRIALRHALLSYLFGTVIIAITINLVAGLGK